MNLKLEIEFSKADLLHEVDALKKQIDDMRPLPDDVEGRVMQKLRLDWNYHSNAIEGNRLSYGETVAFLMEGITAKGKPLKDHLDIRGHNEAINFLLSIVKDTRPISEADVRALHEMILVEPYNVKAETTDGLPTTKRIVPGEYKRLPNHVKTGTGEIHYYATPEETPAKMRELMEWYSETSTNSEIHPVVVAALFHHKFVSIHPFDDGNGRLSRILMNLILMQKGYPPVVIKMDDRQNYYSLLSRADANDNWPFIEYISERLKSSLQLFLKAALGGDIDEDEDIDKEIALLQLQLKGNVSISYRKDVPSMDRVFSMDIIPLSEKIANKLDLFKSSFFDSQNLFDFYHEGIFDSVKSSIKINSDSILNYKGLINPELEKIIISINFGAYKNLDNRFDLSVYATIFFEEFYYNIIVDDNIVVNKLYHEDLNKMDQNQIIKKMIQNFKDQLDAKLKSPKS